MSRVIIATTEVVDFDWLRGLRLELGLEKRGNGFGVGDPVAKSGRTAKNKNIVVLGLRRPRALVERTSESNCFDVDESAMKFTDFKFGVRFKLKFEQPPVFLK